MVVLYSLPSCQKNASLTTPTKPRRLASATTGCSCSREAPRAPVTLTQSVSPPGGWGKATGHKTLPWQAPARIVHASQRILQNCAPPPCAAPKGGNNGLQEYGARATATKRSTNKGYLHPWTCYITYICVSNSVASHILDT